MSAAVNARVLRSLAAAVTLACVAADAATAAASPDVKKAQDSITWLQNFPCPAPGQAMTVAGLESDTQIETMRASNWEFSRQTQARIADVHAKRQLFLQQIAYRELKSKDKTALAALDTDVENAVARIATALVNWNLANFVDISRTPAEFDYQSGRDHPLKEFVQQGAALRNYVSSFPALSERETLLAPITTKFGACLASAQNKVIEKSAAVIQRGKSQATRAADIDLIVSRYVLIGDAQPPSPLVAELSATRQELARVEQMAAEEREKERQAQIAKENAARAEEERKRLAQKVEQATANLPAAKRFVMTLNSGQLPEAAKGMDDDISFSIPGMQTAYGKSAVLELMGKGTTASTGDIQAPHVDSNGEIVSHGQGSRGPFQLYLSISGGLVTAMRIIR